MDDIQVFNVEQFLEAENLLKVSAQDVSRHIKLHSNIWGFTQWGDGIGIRPRHVIDDNNKLLNEWKEDLINDTNKSPEPIKFEPFLNVILLQGIKESIDRDLGISSSVNDWASLGNSSSSESEAQTDLVSEFTDTAYARKQFSVEGQQARTNQTAKYGMLWDDTSFDATPRSIYEAGIHWHLTNSNSCHARVVSTLFTLNAGDLFVSQISELQENGVL